MKSAHGAGFLYTLATQFGITEPHIMVGSSGNAGNVLYFSSGQFESGRRIWREHLSTPRFISPARPWRVMDIDYLVDTVCKQQEPLDVDRLNASPIGWFIPMSDFDTGGIRYVGAADRIDPYEILRAATAVPIFYGKKVSIAHHRYVDGEIGPVLQDHVSFALKRGAKRMLVLNDSAPWTTVSRSIMRAYALHTPHGMHDAIIRDISTSVFHMSAPGIAVIAIAQKNLPAWTLTRDQHRLQETFDRGVGDALAAEKELLNLFKKN